MSDELRRAFEVKLESERNWYSERYVVKAASIEIAISKARKRSRQKDSGEKMRVSCVNELPGEAL